jgi:hypothetical protein
MRRQRIRLGQYRFADARPCFGRKHRPVRVPGGCVEKFQKQGDKTGTGYGQINPGSDSFVYFFTTPAVPAHPAMIKMTFHPMADPRHPQEKDIEFFAAYAGKEEDFQVWSRKVLYDLGRGFGTAVSKQNGK